MLMSLRDGPPDPDRPMWATAPGEIEGDKHDGYGRGGCLRRPRYGDAVGYNYGYVAADEIGCKRRQPIELVLGISILDRYVLALDIAGFLQSERLRSRIISGLGVEEAYNGQRRLLPPRHDRPRGRAPEPRDELPPPH
jgi:hypothetical protein